MQAISRPLALVTGASTGIGHQLAKILAAEGHDLILVARRADVLEAVAGDLRAHGVTVSVCAVDLADSEAIARIDQAIGGGTVTVLVNNAGFNEVGPFATTDLERELAMVQVHLSVMLALCKRVLPAMIASKKGRILNLGSTASFVPSPGDAVYAASKAFILRFSEALAAELRHTGVSVTTLCPGATLSEFPERSGLQDTVLFNLFAATPEAVARAGHRAAVRGRRVVVIGWFNKLQIAFAAVSPPCVRDLFVGLLLMRAPWLRRRGTA